MKIESPAQLPLGLSHAAKRDVRTQFASLCYRTLDDKTQILLITSRGRGRWIIPKGWPIDGLTPAQSAAQEAWEEAGVRGKVFDHCLGLYAYRKIEVNRPTYSCIVNVFPLKVKELAKSYPESGQRKRKWVGPKRAASLVAEPELAYILRHFDPRRFRK